MESVSLKAFCRSAKLDTAEWRWLTFLGGAILPVGSTLGTQQGGNR
jgi:hypothetical protein